MSDEKEPQNTLTRSVDTKDWALASYTDWQYSTPAWLNFSLGDKTFPMVWEQQEAYNKSTYIKPQ